MVWSDTTTNQGVLQECESILFDSDYGKITNSTALKQTFTRYGNKAMDRVSAWIMRFDNSWEFFDANSEYEPIETHNLVADRDDYELETHHAKVLKVRIKDTNGNWKTLRKVSRRNVSDSDIDNSGEPKGYDMLGNFVYLFPKPNYNSTGGMEIQIQSPMSHFTTSDTDKEPGFNSMFHHLIPLWMCYDYAFTKRLAVAKDLRQEIVVEEDRLAEMINQRDYGEAQNFRVNSDDFGGLELGSGSRYSNTPRGFNY
jgi:hypothetical protein